MSMPEKVAADVGHMASWKRCDYNKSWSACQPGLGACGATLVLARQTYSEHFDRGARQTEDTCCH